VPPPFEKYFVPISRHDQRLFSAVQTRRRRRRPGQQDHPGPVRHSGREAGRCEAVGAG